MRKFKTAGHVVMASQVPKKGDQDVDPSYTENQIAEPPDDRTPRTSYPPPPIGQYQYAPGAAAQYYSSAPPQVALAPQTPFANPQNPYAPHPSSYGSPPPPNQGYQTASQPASQQYNQNQPPYNQNQSPYNPYPQQQPYSDPQFNNYGYQAPAATPPNPPMSAPPQPGNAPRSVYGDQSGSSDSFMSPMTQRADTYHHQYPDTSRPPLQRSWGTAPGDFNSPRCRLCGNYVVNGNCTVCSPSQY